MSKQLSPLIFFFFNDTATTEIYTLSLHDALPISPGCPSPGLLAERLDRRGQVLLHDHALRQPVDDVQHHPREQPAYHHSRSEVHTSELQSQSNLVCRLLLEKKKTGVSRDKYLAGK